MKTIIFDPNMGTPFDPKRRKRKQYDLICKECPNTFIGFFNRKFCDECRKRKKIEAWKKEALKPGYQEKKTLLQRIRRQKKMKKVPFKTFICKGCNAFIVRNTRNGRKVWCDNCNPNFL